MPDEPYRLTADPSTLTTTQLLREIANLREILETRLDGMDEAIRLLALYPTRIDEKLGALRELHEEKFAAVQLQFTERDVRTEQTASQTSRAVDAAFAAAKELGERQNQSSALAIAKSETATDKRIDQQGQMIATTSQALDGKINDIKERLTRLEGRGEGGEAKTQSGQQNLSLIIGAAAVIVTLVLGFATVIRSRPELPTAVLTTPAPAPPPAPASAPTVVR